MDQEREKKVVLNVIETNFKYNILLSERSAQPSTNYYIERS